MPKMMRSEVAIAPSDTPNKIPRLAAKFGTLSNHYAAAGI